MIIGIDAATKSGWCLLDTSGRVIESGVQDFTKRRGESNGLLFLRFRKWLSELIGNSPRKIQLVAYERAHMRGGAASELCIGLQTRIQEICAEHKIEASPVHSTSLKKFATGSGKASKEDMMQAAEKLLGRKPIDDNEADALHLARWAYEEFTAF